MLSSKKTAVLTIFLIALLITTIAFYRRASKLEGELKQANQKPGNEEELKALQNQLNQLLELKKNLEKE